MSRHDSDDGDSLLATTKRWLRAVKLLLSVLLLVVSLWEALVALA